MNIYLIFILSATVHKHCVKIVAQLLINTDSEFDVNVVNKAIGLYGTAPTFKKKIFDFIQSFKLMRCSTFFGVISKQLTT